MINQLILVGRIANMEQLEKEKNEKGNSVITIAVPRAYKNIDGEYETDFIDAILFGQVSETTMEYCKKGDVVGIRGRIQSRDIENEDGTKNRKIEIVADKITFLSTKKEDE